MRVGYENWINNVIMSGDRMYSTEVNMNQIDKSSFDEISQIWETPILRPIGKVSNLVLVGLGKLSPPAVDPGEPKKTQPDG